MASGNISEALPTVLRRALEAVQRTAAAHHDAIRHAEAAIAEAADQIAVDRRALAEERAALAREWRELRDARTAAEREAQRMYQDFGDMGEDDESQHTKGVGSPRFKTSPWGRERSRSRSPHGRRAEEELERAMTQAGLDDSAKKTLSTFGPEEAMRMLGQVDEHVRNPSAFIMKMCHRLQEPAPRAVASNNMSDQLEDIIANMRLDEGAARLLRQLPAEQALGMIDQVDKGIRNPSAFLSSLAGRALDSMPSPNAMNAPIRIAGPAERVELLIDKLALDESASRMIRELDPEDALFVLEKVTDDVRNPSAFVMAEVKKHMNSQRGGGGYEAPRGGAYDTPAVERDVAQQVKFLSKELQLDGECMSALESIRVEEAVDILHRLTCNASTIRNRSAFVVAEVRARLKAASQPQAVPSSRAPVSKIPCKFYEKGQCKNGSSCRFSHA
eukprot:TRINITY_DN4170_c0_g1_i1.p1 TRINITY_DN4170_c0_g1~~TRINITY_DN4170_c0_g1_i1.p1  ORF type:complete len:485 (+),score=103.91 TRINITY_DN4170_c0_g1_i1:121-1455(+)